MFRKAKNEIFLFRFFYFIIKIQIKTFLLRLSHSQFHVHENKFKIVMLEIVPCTYNILEEQIQQIICFIFENRNISFSVYPFWLTLNFITFFFWGRSSSMQFYGVIAFIDLLTLTSTDGDENVSHFKLHVSDLQILINRYVQENNNEHKRCDNEFELCLITVA